MKKMIFSAVALVAFSFAGMANEIEEKKVETQKIEISGKATSNNPENCYPQYMAFYNYYVSYLGTENAVLARDLAMGHFQNCLYGHEGGRSIGVLC